MTRRSAPSGAIPLVLSLLLGCGGDEAGGGAGPAAEPATAASPWFEEVASPSGVDFLHGFGPVRLWMPEIGASGVGLFDMDGDGDLDVYAVQGADLGAEGTAGELSNRLYENDGAGRFRDVTERAGVGDTGFGYGCAVGDYDGDGRLDLYVTNVGPNVLYRNRGDGRFEDVTEAAGAAGDGWGTTASFLDIDLDGDLDLYVSCYIRWSPGDERRCDTLRGQHTYCGPNSYGRPARDVLLRNRGDGTFEDVSEQVGLGTATGNGFGLVWGHLDEAPGLDVYVANDGMANQLWSSQPDGTLADRAMVSGCALSGNGAAEAGMGVCLEDIDRDGRWDLMLTHLEGETNTFYMGNGRGFRDRTTRSGTVAASKTRTGFGVGMADFDHDGWLDLFVCNGRVTHPATPLDPERPLAEPDQLFRGGPDGRFEEIPAALAFPGLPLTVGRAAAFGDLDGDGDVDIVTSEYAGPLRILRNVAEKAGGAVTLSILERDGLPAVGAVVRFELAGTRVMRQVQRTFSYNASSDPRVHVGLGAAPGIGPIEVTWLDGETSSFGPVSAGEWPVLRRP